MSSLEYTTGDLLSANAEALVNTVNCVGVMGRGIALQFKTAFPANFKAYKSACDSGEVQPGRMFVFEIGTSANPRYIINFPTKRHWKGKSRMEDVEIGLIALVEEIEARGITSIAIPPLGSGLGGLDWGEVRKRIERALSDVPGVHVIVYEPLDGTEHPLRMRAGQAPKMTEGRAALVMLMERYVGALLDPFVTLIEVHKLMYFLQEAGQPLKLAFAKGHYGPYAENLRHVLRATEGYLTAGYEDGGDAPGKELSVLPGAVAEAQSMLDRAPDARARLDLVFDLVAGFESPFGMELLSTVHWIAVKEAGSAIDDVVAGVYAWNSRKRQFSRQQIELAMLTLTGKGWLSPAAQAITI